MQEQQDSRIAMLFETIKEIQEENTTPKNVKGKLDAVSLILESADDITIKINKAIHELEEVTDDNNLQPYTRTQLWNLISLLEGSLC